MLANIGASIIFILGYLGIATEHKTHINKAAIALVMAGVLWAITALVVPHEIEEALAETGSEIFGITVFLLAAMSLVEILIHYRLFDIIRAKIVERGFTLEQQFLALSAMTFVLSGIVDNLTATIIAIQIARKFFWGRNLLVMAVAIVIAANAGGAFSPVGDVTTIMIWIAGKFTAFEILSKGFLPALVIGLVATGLLIRKIDSSEKRMEGGEEIQTVAAPLSRSEVVITVAALGSFFLPMVAKFIHLPPVIGILFGLGVTWTLVEAFRHVSAQRSHMTATIESLIQKTDIASIKFFVGILLAVSALHTLGVLAYFSQLIYGADQSFMNVVFGNIILGLVSPILDNIPLTAIALSVLDVADPNLWVLLALTVGTGGSLLSIGSAAGVVAMGMLKKLTFGEYFKIGFVPALLSFAAGIGVWAIEIWL